MVEQQSEPHPGQAVQIRGNSVHLLYCVLGSFFIVFVVLGSIFVAVAVVAGVRWLELPIDMPVRCLPYKGRLKSKRRTTIWLGRVYCQLFKPLPQQVGKCFHRRHYHRRQQRAKIVVHIIEGVRLPPVAVKVHVNC